MTEQTQFTSASHDGMLLWVHETAPSLGLCVIIRPVVAQMRASLKAQCNVWRCTQESHTKREPFKILL